MHRYRYVHRQTTRKTANTYSTFLFLTTRSDILHRMFSVFARAGASLLQLALGRHSFDLHSFLFYCIAELSPFSVCYELGLSAFY